MHGERYERYITSDAWTRRKVEYFWIREKVCWACGSKDSIHLHHHTYDRLGNELNEDLVPLCKTCHRLVHEHHRIHGGSLTEATRAIVTGREIVLVPRPVIVRTPRPKSGRRVNVRQGKNRARRRRKRAS